MIISWILLLAVVNLFFKSEFIDFYDMNFKALFVKLKVKPFSWWFFSAHQILMIDGFIFEL